ncbi:ABC transporter permease subunit [Salinicola corii]|uniref:ABC transporter permease subunit n=1 Tax=Salinicola corii TaxID=2606937 RepID=A0A640W8E4_9GAMM|nr:MULTISPECIES: ABC transporter permease subunit [Salinicola]KAA0016018.1 ABC transporter permease subunit [Salinicola corii]MAM57494.1 peptide ABC transporter permease [Salinicola sp.]NRB56355.1 ABC transporter permease subunit [Salinicola sp.]
MFKFFLVKLAQLVPTFIGVTIVAFAFIRLLPGDPILLMAGERGISAERYAQLESQMGFDRSLVVQYLDFLKGLLHGDLGNSLVTHAPVMDEFMSRFPATLELSLFALAFAVIIGLPAGVLAAVKRGKTLDHTIMGVSLTGYSMPIFWWGLLLIMLFSSTLGWTPVSGRISYMYFIEPVTGFMTIDSLIAGDWGAFLSSLHYLILPSIVLGTIPLAVIARQTRSSMLEVLGEDYVRTARAKGLSNFRVIMVHTLRNALISVVTVIGLQVGLLLAGAILTETIFSWPGIGKWMIDAISRRDYPSVQGGLVLIAFIVMIVNLLVDLAYGVINPRIRH